MTRRRLKCAPGAQWTVQGWRQEPTTQHQTQAGTYSHLTEDSPPWSERGQRGCALQGARKADWKERPVTGWEDHRVWSVLEAQCPGRRQWAGERNPADASVTPRLLVAGPRAGSLLVGTSSWSQCARRRMEWEELGHRAHLGNAFEKFCCRRAKRNSSVSHGKGGNERASYSQKSTRCLCVLVEWSLLTRV